MAQLGENITNDELIQIYKDADEEGNGFITFDEFNGIYQNIIAE